MTNNWNYYQVHYEDILKELYSLNKIHGLNKIHTPYILDSNTIYMGLNFIKCKSGYTRKWYKQKKVLYAPFKYKGFNIDLGFN